MMTDDLTSFAPSTSADDLAGLAQLSPAPLVEHEDMLSGVHEPATSTSPTLRTCTDSLVLLT